MTSAITSIVEQTLGRSRIPERAKPRDPLAWTAEQALRLDLPCGAGERLQQASTPAAEPVVDPADRCAAWVASTRRCVTWVDVREHFGWSRYYAMRLLREGAERGLLRRIASHNSKRPDLFEGVR